MENSTSTFLEKDENTPKIYRFRNIHLLKADLEFIMKISWSDKLPKLFEKNTITRLSGWRQKTKKSSKCDINLKFFCTTHEEYYGE